MKRLFSLTRALVARKRKIFALFFALAASIGMMNAKVTWKSCNISDLNVQETYQSYSKEGVTLSANADMIDAHWYGYGDESHAGIEFHMSATGGFTFSNSLGKNFTKIEMTLNGPAGWDNNENLGSGWLFNWNHGEESITFTVTWTGNAKTVDLLKEASNFHGEQVKRIVFYFEGDSEAPDPTYTVALKDGTANADKVTLSATSVEECTTVTVTPNEECDITDFSAYYVVVDGQLGTINTIDATLNTETGAYSFKMPAADVTIEATITLKPVPEGDVFAGFTATAGSGGFDNEGHANLVDGKFTSAEWTKWCTNNDHRSVPTGESGDACWWIDFEASAALDLTGYSLTTGNDTGNEHGRNPKNWVLKAKLNADDAWTTIATVTNDVAMKNQSFKDYKFFVDQSGSYKYFRFEVFANQGANVMQLCELRLIGTEASAPANSCGDGLTWEFDPATGALTISYDGEGTGVMNDYSWAPNAAPWYAYKDAITSVSFPEGITTIGAYAFVSCDNAAFTTVTIPEGVTALGVNAFYNCDGIQEITIPSTVTTIGVGAIYDCKAVNSITSYIASPTNLHGFAIYGYKNTCTLYVPYASIADYQAAECWKNIPNIAAIPGTLTPEGVIEKINAIGTVELTAECKAKIDEARAAYNALSDGDKDLVTNYETLTDAETAYAALNQAEADKVVAKINEIPSPMTAENTKLSVYNKVQDARAAYDALTADQQALVSNLDKLEAAEAAFAAIGGGTKPVNIVWDINTGINEVAINTTSPAYEGITVTTGKGNRFYQKTTDPIMLRFFFSGGAGRYAFAKEDGSHFTKVVLISSVAMGEWLREPSRIGTDWVVSDDYKKATWIGDADTVKIWDGASATAWVDVDSIVFTVNGPASPLADAQAAKDLIDAIGEVSYPDSKEAIKAAREAVDALGANASLLENADLQKLTDAEAAYAQLLAQAVKAVKDQIDALPATPLTDATKKLSEYNKVTDAREAYDALSDEEKAAVTNYGKLEAAEAAFAAIGGGTGLNVSTEDIGKVLCADGSLYATKDEATAASKTPVAMIAYVEDSKGLAIALEDESNTMIWSTAITTAAAHTPAVTGGTWKLPSLLEWQQMFVGCGADLTPSETSGNVTDYLGLRDKLLAAGGNGFVEWSYWTTTEWADNPAEAWDPYFSFSPEIVKWYKNKKDRDDFYIRAILAFNVVASTALADAQAALDKINAIPDPVVVSDECKAKIDAAREAVTALGENASLLDDADIDKLAKAEADFALLIKDATAVAGMIDAIGEVTFSAESKEKIVDARKAYDALSDELKPYVSNIDKLTAAEAAYEAARPFATVTTVPAAVEALQYTGAAQALITAGAAEHGTILYSLDGENYSTELPTALLAGAYTIYYKVQATDDYKDVAPVTVIATIAYNYPATYGLFGIPEGWSVKVNDEEVAVVNGAVKNIAANDRFDIMPVKPEDVKRVEIVPYLLDLATVTDSVIYILDGDSITGTANGHITVVIVPDAKVYFKDVNLTNTGSHPAVLCGGNAEIVVVGENTITCTTEDEYGIRAAGAGTTLTVSGDKTLLKATIDPNGGTVNQ